MAGSSTKVKLGALQQSQGFRDGLVPVIPSPGSGWSGK